jgi:hypothetical protein
MDLSHQMAELIGAIIGDGNIYKNRYVEISGDRNLDIDYYKNKLLPIIVKELYYIPSIRTGSFGVRLRINNKKFTLFLNNLGIQSGRGKTYKVLIPNIICQNWELSKSCIRGIIDTNGCLSFDKRKIYKTPYPRIILHLRNKKLCLQIYKLLLSKGFKPTLSKQVTKYGKAHTVYLNGKVQVLKYIKDIGFSNSRHSKKGALLLNDCLGSSVVVAPVS